MANTIITKNSATATAVPTAGQLVQGELAVNVTDKRLFTENSGGTVVEVGTNPSSVTLSSGTANGVTYLNGSKVLTSGSALTFDGSTFTTTAGIEGTKLTTAGNISLYNSVSSQLTHYQQLSSSYTASYIQSALSGASSSLVFAVNSNWTNSNAVEGMRLTSTGLGIGTSSPQTALSFPIGTSKYIGQTQGSAHVAGNVGSMGFGVADGGGQSGVFVHNTHNGTYSSQDIRFVTAQGGVTGATERMRITSGGLVGIGTTSPGQRFHVDGGRSTFYSQDNYAVGVGNASGALGGWIGSPALNVISFSEPGGAERMRITSSGNLLVGGTTATAKNYTTQTANAIALGAENQVGSFTSTVFQTGAYGTAAGTGFRHIQCLGSGAQTVFQVLGNGNAQNTNNSYGAVSDVKLKENIVDATPKLAGLMQVQVRNYNMIGDTTKQIGVVAQELEAVFPAMVDETTDRDKEGNDLGTTTKSVKYSVFVPMLIKAIQEQQAIIEDMKTRLAAAGI